MNEMSGNREKPRTHYVNWDIRINHEFHSKKIDTGIQDIPYRRDFMSVDGLTMDHSLWVFYVMLKNEFKMWQELEMPQFEKSPREMLDDISREPRGE